MAREKELPKCIDCGTEIKELMVEGGLLKRGCQQCWAKNNFEGDPPCNLGIVGKQLTQDTLNKKIQKRMSVVTREEVEEEQRLQKKAERLEKLKQKNPLKQAFHAMIRHIQAKNLSEYELFQEIDQDGDGSLTRMEMAAALRKLGVNLLTLELDAVLRVFDADGSGEIDFAEFYKALKEEEANVEGIVRHGPDPRLCGFQLGQRVRMKCQLLRDVSNSGKNVLTDVNAGVNAGKVMGPGTSNGLLLVVLDSSGEALNVKAKSLEAWNIPAKHDALCKCDKCYAEFCALEDEDDGNWCS